MPWRSKVRRNVPNNQRGRVTPSQNSRGVGRSGVEKPVRTLFSRLADTGVSTVSTSVQNPAAATRSISAPMRGSSPGRYAWNHAPGLADATSSSRISDEPLMIIGTPASTAARANTRSPR